MWLDDFESRLTAEQQESFRSLRELVISYFEFYFSVLGEKTLRSYCRPLNLARFDSAGWMWRDEGLEPVIR